MSIAVFVLCLANADFVSKKRGCKLVAIILINSNCIEMIFTLLAEPVVI